MLRKHAQGSGGFTLIEAVVTLSIFATLAALTLPSMQLWIRNAKVRSVADSLQNGLRLAQAESLRRSRQTVFYLTNSTTPQTSLTADANGSYWAVNTIPSLAGELTAFVQSAEVGIASTNVAVAGPTAVCFNSVGRLVANATTGIAGATCVLPPAVPPVQMYNVNVAGADRPLNVMVTLGGQVHLCDPAKSLATDPDGCPP